MQEVKTGLWIVSTPIGNLKDISSRALNVLSECDLIACEDTRVTNKLLKNYDINNKKLISYRDGNEKTKYHFLIKTIEEGKSVALVVDAGTPGVSDPGFRIVRECRRLSLPINVVPGPSAFLSALVSSGFPSDHFFFGGFLPNKTFGRKKMFEEWKDFPYTIIFYESCHRIVRSINDLIEILGQDRLICVAKEITKLHENFFLGKSGEVIEKINKNVPKGEFVVIIPSKSFVL